MKQGTKANLNGSKLETRIALILDTLDIDYIKQDKFVSIYNYNAKMDFYIPSLDLAIEAKNQEVSGSVSEKLPYVVLNLEKHSAKNGLIVLGGSYWKNKTGIFDWIINFSKSFNTNINCIFEEELESFLIEQTNSRN